MNEIVNKFLLAAEKLMSKMHVRQLGVTVLEGHLP